MRNIHHAELFPVLSFFSQGVDICQIIVVHKVNQLFSKKKPSQGRLSYKGKHDTKDQLPVSSFFQYPGFILMISRYLEVQQAVTLKEINKAFRKELSSHLIGRRFLEEKPEPLQHLQRLLAQPPRQVTEFKQIFPEDKKLLDTKAPNIDFSRLSATQISALIQDCQEVKKIHREYKALVPLRAIREIFSNIYTGIAGSRTCRYGLTAVYFLFVVVPYMQEDFMGDRTIRNNNNNNPPESFTGIIIPVTIQIMLPAILTFVYIQTHYDQMTNFCQNIPQYFNELLDAISLPVRLYREYKFPDTLAKVNQLEGKAIFWASLPRQESTDSNLLPEQGSKFRAANL
jgi:hypothetical protein